MNYDPELLEYLKKFVTDERFLKMQKVLSFRTRYITVVLEDIFQPHNASAVLRTCDALGVQDVHIVEKSNSYKVNPEIALGSSQWLSLQTYNRKKDDIDVYARLKASGYRLVATSPHAKEGSIFDFPLEEGPIALMFGTELEGLSEEALNKAEARVSIPMFGFVESFNISVSVALCLSQLCHSLRASKIAWNLTELEQKSLLQEWTFKSIKRGDQIVEDFNKKRGN